VRRLGRRKAIENVTVRPSRLSWWEEGIGRGRWRKMRPILLDLALKPGELEKPRGKGRGTGDPVSQEE